MPFTFLKRLFDAQPAAVDRGQWDSILNRMETEFGACRTSWFSLCVELLKDEPNQKSSPALAGEAEVATCVYQCILALEFIATKGYIAPSDGTAFANQLLARLTYGAHSLKRDELYRRMLAGRQKGDGLEIFGLCDLILTRILAEQSLPANLTLASTIPIFTNINSSVVATAFGDKATLQRLEQARNNC